MPTSPIQRASYSTGEQQIQLGAATRQTLLPLDGDLTGALLRIGVVLAGVSHFADGMRIQRQHQGFHVLFLSLDGQCRLRSGDLDAAIGPQETWLLPSRTPHLYHCEPSGWEVIWFHLSDSVYRPDLQGTPVRRIPWFPARTPTLVDGLIYESELGRYNSLSSGQAYATIIANVIDRLLESDATHPLAHQRLALDRLWSQVAVQLDQPWTIEQMARQVSLSITHFHRLMLTHYGVNPKALLRRLRMQRARERLLQGNATLETIAEEVGYACPFSFSKAFKREIGMNPRQFRQAALNLEPPA